MVIRPADVAIAGAMMMMINSGGGGSGSGSGASLKTAAATDGPTLPNDSLA